MARPPDTKAKRIERRAQKAATLIGLGMPKSKACQVAGIVQRTFRRRNAQAGISEHAAEFMVRMRNAQAQQ